MIDIRDEPVGGLLRDIERRIPSPGGGAVAGLCAARGTVATALLLRNTIAGNLARGHREPITETTTEPAHH